jgi:glutamyl-tRNA synthetase
MTLRGRYAPSPTGSLHLGNARTALVAYLSARSRGGAFAMRVEDLDTQRSQPEFVQANLSELRWLGLEWDEGPRAPCLQSERLGRYQQALEAL